MRGVRRLMVVAAVAFGMFATLGATPAMAGLGTGQVTGTVSTDGIGACPAGNPLCRKPQNNITFSGVLITGTFTSNDNSQVFAGSVKVGTSNSVTARSTTGGTLADDAGVVFPFSVDDALSVTGNITNGAPPNGCAGTYQRAGSIVLVPLQCKFSINGRPVNSAVTVVAQFSPTQGDGVTTPITQANFTGIYVAV
ncbi:MAG TPA: hypothetical protein VM841_14695 [Actinomycetota bacterium]|nr:hypothetical protein [Actinomycetota bacterium]